MTNPPLPSSHVTGALWHPTEYPRIIYKRRWAALPVFLVVFLSGTLSSIRTVPIFEATTQVMIDRDARRPTSINDVLEDRSSYYDDDFLPTQFRIMQSRALALRVAQALDRDGVKERRPASGGYSFSLSGLLSRAVSGAVSLLPRRATPPPPATAVAIPGDATVSQAVSALASALQGGLIVAPVRSSRLVDLRFRSPDPAYAARAADEFAEQYKQQSVEFRYNNSKGTNVWLSGQLETQRKVVEASDAALQQFRESHRSVSVGDKQSNIVVQRLNDLNAQLTEARFERVGKQATYEQVQVVRGESRSLDTIPGVMTNEVVLKAKADVSVLQQEKLRLDSRGLGPAHPDMQAWKLSMTAAQTRLDAEYEKVADSLRIEFMAAKAKEDSMAAELERQKSTALGQDRQEMEFAQLEREATGNRELYNKLLQNTKESDVSGEYRGSNVMVLDRAVIPGGPVLPNVQRDLSLSAFSGMLLALLLAFSIEYFDSRIKSPEEIRQHLGLPFLGLVPLAGDKKNGVTESPLITGGGTPEFMEAMRGLRTAVLFSTADEQSRSILVTSTGPHEGKTLVSSSLAASLAQAGQRTLVIDADMRRPRLHEALGGLQEPGLSNVLVGDTSVDAAIRPTPVPNLFVLVAGHVPPNPAELLGSKKCLDLLAELKTRFDWIILDAPPVLPVTDAAVLAHATGGVLFVVGAEMTPRQSALVAIGQLKQANAKMLGVVLNRVDVRKHSYYYRAYYKKEYREVPPPVG